MNLLLKRLVLLSCGFALTAAAQSNERIVVTATRSAQQLIESLADVTLIDAEEIAHAGAMSLVELLQRVPGLEISSNGGPGSVSSIFIRGANRGHTLLLIDGVRVNSATSGSTALEAIPLEQIERIEILKGPASSLYGADAIGGVIQVFTRSGRNFSGVHYSVGGGSDRTGKVSIGWSKQEDRWRYSVNTAYSESTGFTALQNPRAFGFNPDKDGYRSANASAQISHRLAPSHEFGAQLMINRLNSQFDASADFDDRAHTNLRTLAAYSRNRWLPGWTSFIQVGRGTDDSDSQSRFGKSNFRTDQTQYAWQNDITLDSGFLQLAFERREEQLSSTIAYAVKDRSTNSAQVSYRWQSGLQHMQVNLRHDDNSQFGGKTTGAIAYGYRVAPSFRLRGSVGTAFKAPSFNDLYFPGFSNPSLRPETARSAEIGVHYHDHQHQANLVLYSNRVRDLIVFQGRAPVNVNQARLSGASFSYALMLGSTECKFSVDRQQPEDAHTGKLLPRRARWHGSVVLQQRWQAWQWGLEWLASSARYEDAANNQSLAGYGVINLTTAYRISPVLQVVLRANNVLDRRYELARDYRTPRANLFVGLRGQW